MSNFLIKNGDKAEWGIPEGYPYDERITLDLSKKYTTVEEIMSVELLYGNTFIKLYDNVLSDTDVETMSVLFDGMSLTDAGAITHAKNEDGIYIVTSTIGSQSSPTFAVVPDDNTIGATPGVYIFQQFYGSKLVLSYGKIEKFAEKYLPDDVRPEFIVEVDFDDENLTFTNPSKTYSEIGEAQKIGKRIVLHGMQTFMGLKIVKYIFYPIRNDFSIYFISYNPPDANENHHSVFVARLRESSDGNGTWFVKKVSVPFGQNTIGKVFMVSETDDDGVITKWEPIDPYVIASSTEGSTKKFKITVDDSGTLSATEVTT